MSALWISSGLLDNPEWNSLSNAAAASLVRCLLGDDAPMQEPARAELAAAGLLDSDGAPNVGAIFTRLGMIRGILPPPDADEPGVTA